MIEFLSANWLWILLVVAFMAMHRSGMGCGMGHGGHGGHGGHSDRMEDERRPQGSDHDAASPRDGGVR